MRRVFLFMALVTVAAPLEAQIDSLVGKRVWVRPLSRYGSLERGVKGTVRRVAADTLYLRMGPYDRAVPILTNRGEVFVSAGRRSNAGRGAGIGFLAGAVVGAALGYAAGEDCGGNRFLCLDRREMALGGGVLLGGVGTLIGLAAGAALPSERWVPAGSSLTVGPSFSPAGRGVRLGMAVDF